MQRIGVLNGNNITYDHDLAGLVRGLTDWGVIQGGEITGNKVQPVQAVIACQRSNGQKLMLYFESDEQVAIPSSWTFKVYIEVNQAKIDDGTGNAENGTGIAEIKTWPTLPSQNFLLLASVAGWVVKDERNLIPKIQSVAQRTDSLEEKLSTAEGQIIQLVEAGNPKFIEINKTVSGNTTSQRSAPADWLLKIECQASAIWVSGGKIFINWEMVFGFHHANDYPNIWAILLIPAKEGIINIQTQTNNWSASVKLLLFIAFQWKKS